MYFLILATLALAIITYWVVERPFRKSSFSRKKIFSFSIALTALIGATGVVIGQFNGVPERMGDSRTLFDDMVYYKEQYWEDYAGFANEKDKMIDAFSTESINVLVIGNSWGLDIANAIASINQYDVAFEGLTGHKCNEFRIPDLPETNSRYSNWQTTCSNNVERFSNIPENTKVVILADNVFRNGQYDHQDALVAFENNISDIRQSFNGPILIVKGRPTWGFGGGFNIASKMKSLTPSSNIHIQHLLHQPLNEMISIDAYYKDFYSPKGIVYSSLIEPLCPKISTERVCQLVGENKITYFDGGHLTKFGGVLIRDHLDSHIRDSLLIDDK